ADRGRRRPARRPGLGILHGRLSPAGRRVRAGPLRLERRLRHDVGQRPQPRADCDCTDPDLRLPVQRGPDRVNPAGAAGLVIRRRACKPWGRACSWALSDARVRTVGPPGWKIEPPVAFDSSGFVALDLRVAARLTIAPAPGSKIQAPRGLA